MKFRNLFLIFILMMLSINFTLAYSGSGIISDPYLVSNCNDFHLLNSDEDYTSKVYISLIDNIDCSSFSDTYLINKTINGIDIDGQNYNISGYPNSYIFPTVYTGVNDYIKNIKFTDGVFANLFFNIVFDTSGDILNIVNISNYNLDDNSNYNFAYLSNKVTANAQGTLNVYRYKIENSIMDYYREGYNFIHETYGTKYLIDYNLSKIYVNNLSQKYAPVNYGLLGGISGGIEIFENIYVDNFYYNLSYLSTDSSNRVTILNRIFTYHNVSLKNMFYFGDSYKYGSDSGLIGSYDSDVSNLVLDYVIMTGAQVSVNNFFSSGSTVNYNANNSFYNDDIVNIETPVSGITGKTLTQLKTVATYDNWSTDIWYLQDGSYPFPQWILEDLPIVYSISCINTDYEIYEYSNLYYNVSCFTNGFFDNYTLDSNFTDISLNSNITISGIVTDAKVGNISLTVCLNTGECEDYNISVTWKTDDIKPVCESLPNLIIYENTTFNLPVECSDNYTNLTLFVYYSPSLLNTTYVVNSSIYSGNLSLQSPTFDFFLYLKVNDSRNNTNIYSKFYTVLDTPSIRNETFKQSELNTGSSIIFIGIVFLSILLLIIGLLFQIPIIIIFSGVIVIFSGVILVDYSFIIGVSITLLGIVILALALRNIILDK